MNIIQRSKGSWWARVQINGYRHSITVHATTKGQAKEKILDEVRRIKRFGKSDIKTLNDAFAMWIQQDFPASMKQHARAVLANIGEYPLSSTPQAANNWAFEMNNKGYSPCTINRRLACVKRVLKLALSRWHWIELPLHEKVHMFSEKGTAREIFLSPEQIKELCGHMKHADSPAFFIAAASTGLRPWSELYSLNPSQIVDGAIYLKPGETKNKRSRTIPISAELEEMLAHHLPWSASQSQLRKDWEYARAQVGHPEWQMRDLRHTFASWLVTQPDVPLTVIRDLMGHSTLAVTSKYSHLRTDSLRAATSTLPKFDFQNGTNSGTMKKGKLKIPHEKST